VPKENARQHPQLHGRGEEKMRLGISAILLQSIDTLVSPGRKKNLHETSVRGGKGRVQPFSSMFVSVVGASLRKGAPSLGGRNPPSASTAKKGAH